MPINLDLSLTNRCNKEPPCEVCPFHGPGAVFKKPPMDMEWGLYRKIIDEYSEKGGWAIKIDFDGEPLLYKFIIEAIYYAKSRGILDVRLNTNGLAIDKTLAVRLIVSKLDVLVLSDYDDPRQRENIDLLQEMKEMFHADKPKVDVKTFNASNWYGLADTIREHIFYDYNKPTFNYEESEYECEMPWQRFLILANGDVLRCSCGMLLESEIIGNVKNQSIEELWGGEEMKRMRSAHQFHKTHTIEGCIRCPGRHEFIELKKKEEIKNG
jgi:radical SAM protein with 4Fe4S-binding SPASM domain